MVEKLDNMLDKFIGELGYIKRIKWMIYNWKKSINEILNLRDGFNSRLDTGEEKISDLCGRSMEIPSARPGEK